MLNSKLSPAASPSKNFSPSAAAHYLKNSRMGLWLADAIIAAALLTYIASTGILSDFDYKTSDWLYQRERDPGNDIIVVGIDSDTINRFGPIPYWIRREMANAVTKLNNDYPASRPAVIGIDWRFNGDNPDDVETDSAFVAAAAQYRNVVVASEAVMEYGVTEEYDPDFVWPWDPPYPALLAVTENGHINGPDDSDGIQRHDFLFVNVEEQGKLLSFPRVVYEKWCTATHRQIKPPPETFADGIFYIPFTAKKFSRGYNLADLLDGKIPPAAYAGKIVLIGCYADGLADDYPTALDRNYSMYGVDIHANVIKAFQEGFFPQEADEGFQLALLFFICVGAELFFLHKRMRYVLLLWLLTCLIWLDICLICYRSEIILHTLYVPLSVSVLFIGSIAANYLRAELGKARLEKIFERYVDAAVMRQLLKEDSNELELGGKMQNIAVLFVDIRGFTPLSEKLDAPQVVKILNHYLTHITDCIYAHHGTLDKFVGDCAMAFWNAPLEQDRPVHLAAQAALDMVNGATKLNQTLEKLYGRQISFGVGLHWGSAVIGNIGSKTRMDYTAIGDTVNTAARIEANTPGGKVYVSREVADILGDDAKLTSLPEKIKLKGKTDDFEVLELKSLNRKEENPLERK